MANENPLHPTIDSNARKGQGEYVSPTRNARATYAPKNAQSPRIYIPGISTSYRNKLATTPNDSEVLNPDEVAAGSQPVRRPRSVKRGLRRQAEGTLRLLAIRARLTPVVAGISVWAAFFYIGQLIFAVLAFAGLGIAILLEGAGGTSTPEIVAALSAQLFNLDFSVGLLLFFAFSFLIFVLYLIEILVATAVLKVALVHPWFGKGAAFKIGSIMLILISSFIPLLNMFPLFWLWIFAVLLNPK